MTTTRQDQDSFDAVLERDVDYTGADLSVRSLEKTINQERQQQNKNVETLSNLRQRNAELQQQLTSEVDKMKELTEELNKERERSDLMRSVRKFMSSLPVFGDQIITKKSIEQLLRSQYELSSQRVKEAAEFADRLEAAKHDLYDEIDRLNQKIIESSENEDIASKRVLELTKLKDRLESAVDGAELGSTRHRELQMRLDRTKRQLAEHSTKLKLYTTAEDRLAKLQENTRQLAGTIANLQSDITAYVTAASEKLDLIAGQIQAIGAAADASVVMLEMKQSLEAMTESVNHATRFVSETQSYFRQNVDHMIEDLELYDAETQQVLDHNQALNEVIDDERIAEAVSTALVNEMDDGVNDEQDEKVVLEQVQKATIEDLERMQVPAGASKTSSS